MTYSHIIFRRQRPAEKCQNFLICGVSVYQYPSHSLGRLEGLIKYQSRSLEKKYPEGVKRFKFVLFFYENKIQPLPTPPPPEKSNIFSHVLIYLQPN